MSKNKQIASVLLYKDNNGMIDWESYIDDLTTNLYIDETKEGDNTISGDRLLFDEVYRSTILAGDATGTLNGYYLDPTPLINKLAQTYQEARHDEIKMNIKNMDYTNKIISDDEDIDQDAYYIGNIKVEDFFNLLDINNDGVLGLDDALLFRAITILYADYTPITAQDLFNQIFDMRGDITQWDKDILYTANDNDELLTYNEYHSSEKRDILLKTGNGDFYLKSYTYRYKEDDQDKKVLGYCPYFNVENRTFYQCSNDLFEKLTTISIDGGVPINSVLASKIRVIINEINKDKEITGNELRPAYVTKEEFITFVKATHFFPTDPYIKLKRYLNLLMPRYARRVEVEDLNKNFWVLGQVCDGMAEAIWRDDGIVDAIQALINQLNKVTNEVNTINMIYGLTGEINISLEGDKYASMVDGYDLTNLYIKIENGNGARKIKVPIYNNLQNQVDNLNYSSWENFVTSWSEAPAAAINLWDLYENTGDFINVENLPTKILNEKIVHSFFYLTSQNSNNTQEYNWYLDELNALIAAQQDFVFVKDLNILMYNPDYYKYEKLAGNDYFSLIEVSASDRRKAPFEYIYPTNKIIAIPSNAIVGFELIMINFNPKNAATDNITIAENSINNFKDYLGLDLHIACASRSGYRFEPNFVLKMAKYDRKTGIGVQYYCPPLVNKNGEIMSEAISLSNIFKIKESMITPHSGTLKDISEKSTTISILSNNKLNSYLTIFGENGNAGVMTYKASGSAHPNGVVQGRIAQLLDHSGMSWSSDGQANNEEQLRHLLEEDNGAFMNKLYTSQSISLSENVTNNLVASENQQYIWNNKSYNVCGGWYKVSCQLEDIFDMTTSNDRTLSTNIYQTLKDENNHIIGTNNIESFVQYIGLKYGNAYAIAEYPNDINPAITPLLPNTFINIGDANISVPRHCRQIVFVPICYDAPIPWTAGYARYIYADLNKCTLLMFNWKDVSRQLHTSSTMIYYKADNISNSWIITENNERKWNLDNPPIGYIMIAAAAGMPAGYGDGIPDISDIEKYPIEPYTGNLSNWTNPCGDVDTTYPEMFGLALTEGTYLFERPAGNVNVNNHIIPDDNAITIFRVDNNIS